MARVALVTGGTRGIGKAIVQRLKEDGMAVAAGYSGNVEAAEATGGGRLHILRRHMLPQLAPLLLGLAPVVAAMVMLTEAALSVLGVGVPAPGVSWGTLIGWPGVSCNWAACPICRRPRCWRAAMLRMTNRCRSRT